VFLLVLLTCTQAPVLTERFSKRIVAAEAAAPASTDVVPKED